jgi:hypothetical protein
MSSSSCTWPPKSNLTEPRGMRNEEQGDAKAAGCDPQKMKIA